MYKLKIYKDVINNPIYSRQYKKTIEEKIQNLENYQISKYDNLLANQKAVNLKWVFKVKYTQNGNIIWYKVWFIMQEFSWVYKIYFNKIFSLKFRKSYYISF